MFPPHQHSPANWHVDIWATRFGLENFERGEVVSPQEASLAKLSGLNLAMPDARHRRPLKNLFIPSK
jgi:hypothetical protein